MPKDTASCSPGELHDLRRDERWRDGRLATVHARGEAWPALTGELSLRGMRLAIHGVEVLLQEILEIEVAFEDAMVPFTGTVRHVSTTPWGCIAGIAFPEHAFSYLARRYLAQRR